ncbi:putative N-acetyltransferase 5 [Papiliotrema laurentii]|uniref:N-acetyltransferase 5 n=1 Tax=Papiliotrema laurentii TaxID=5418 RepID=A0AAD9FVU2_PAPLA|nr:putative N-acetyltransferase 5 [Papiliotrema laurentii]
MSITRPFEATDVLKFNQVNADPWTATYGNGYYASYLAQWPEWCVTTTGAFGTEIQSYMIAKHEPAPPNPQHHGHLTALSISPPVRGLGLARFYMDMLERLSGPAGQVACDHDHNEEGGDHGGPHPHSHSHAQAGGDCVDAWFVDLFVRCNNGRAVDMYEKLGYSVYRRVVE